MPSQMECGKNLTADGRLTASNRNADTDGLALPVRHAFKLPGDETDMGWVRKFRVDEPPELYQIASSYLVDRRTDQRRANSRIHRARPAFSQSFASVGVAWKASQSARGIATP